MQQTRQLILEVLHERGDCTVDELVLVLGDRIQHDITPVTIRHHIDILRSEELVTPPVIRRRNSPGRPQHVYSLTEKALEYFPNNYQNLADNLLRQVKATLPQAEVNVIIEKMADHMVENAGALSKSLESRMDQIVKYLNGQGYNAEWESCADGFILRTRNCPYRAIADHHRELCSFDSHLITGLIGIVPRLIGRMTDNCDSCEYLIPVKQGNKFPT